MQFLQIIANFMGCAHRNMCILHEDTHIEISDMCIVLVLCTIAYLRPYQYPTLPISYPASTNIGIFLIFQPQVINVSPTYKDFFEFS